MICARGRREEAEGAVAAARAAEARAWVARAKARARVEETRVRARVRVEEVASEGNHVALLEAAWEREVVMARVATALAARVAQRRREPTRRRDTCHQHPMRIG